MSAKLNANVLQCFRCFEPLSDEEAEVAAAQMEAVRLTHGQTLFEQRETGDSVYLRRSGRIEIEVNVPGQADRLLATLDGGAILGEISVLLSEPRTAAAVAKGETELSRVGRSEFHAALERGEIWAHKFLLAISEVLAHRLAALDQELVQLIAGPRKDEEQPLGTRVAELEHLRTRLFTKWSF